MEIVQVFGWIRNTFRSDHCSEYQFHSNSNRNGNTFPGRTVFLPRPELRLLDVFLVARDLPGELVAAALRSAFEVNWPQGGGRRGGDLTGETNIFLVLAKKKV